MPHAIGGDIAQVLLDDDAGLHFIIDRREDSLQRGRVAGDPLAKTGNAGGQLDPHFTIVEQTSPGAQRILAREHAVSVQHGLLHASRKFGGPSEWRICLGGHQRMSDRLGCDERHGNDATEQILHAVDAQTGGENTVKRGAGHEVRRIRIPRAGVVLAPVLVAGQADQAPGNFRPR